jgi:hypothetical protein
VNLGPAAKLAYVQQPSVIASTSTFGVSMMVEDIAGNFLPTDNSSVHLAIVGGPVNGQLGGTFTTNAVNGIVTFNKVSLYQNTGLFTLSASLPGAVANYSAPIIVTSTPVRLVIAQQPSPDATSGHTLSPIIVQILDASGLVAHDNSHVTVTLVNPKGATLGGTKTVTATNGVATFSDLSISKPGTYTLKMTDGTLGPATTRTITVVAPGVVRATTTSLVASRSSVLSGQSLTLTATANPGGSLPARTGTITFFDGSTQIGTAIALDANSTASITITPTGAGVHHYKVVYSGDTNYKGSTSKVVNVKVNPLLIPLVWLDK